MRTRKVSLRERRVGPPKKGYMSKKITQVNKKLLRVYGLKVPK